MAGALKCRKREPEKRKTCTKCGRMGHLAAGCERPDKAHDKLGIEVEGYWRDVHALRKTAHDAGALAPKSDGSLGSVNYCDDRCGHYDTCGICQCASAEVCTAAGSLGEALRQMVAVYPDSTSPAAAMHVHMSFRDAGAITLLSSDMFYAYFIERWTAFGQTHKIAAESEFWKRLRGDNRYAMRNEPMVTGTVAQPGNGEKYRQLNFGAWNSYKTVECRLLPMFQSCDLAVKAIEEWIAIVEDFLATVKAEVTCTVPISEVPALDAITLGSESDVSSEVAALVESRTIEIVEIEIAVPEDASPDAIVVPRCYARERIAELYRDLDLPE